MAKPFKGTINVDIRDSEPDWTPFEPPVAPYGAPNVLYIVLDDWPRRSWSNAAGTRISSASGTCARKRR